MATPLARRSTGGCDRGDSRMGGGWCAHRGALVRHVGVLPRTTRCGGRAGSLLGGRPSRSNLGRSIHGPQRGGICCTVRSNQGEGVRMTMPILYWTAAGLAVVVIAGRVAALAYARRRSGRATPAGSIASAPPSISQEESRQLVRDVQRLTYEKKQLLAQNRVLSKELDDLQAALLIQRAHRSSPSLEVEARRAQFTRAKDRWGSIEVQSPAARPPLTTRRMA